MVRNKLTWKIGGEAGFGIKVTGLIFSKVALRLGFKVFGYDEYPSLIRGGHQTYQATLDDKEAHSSRLGISLLVALNKETVDLHQNELVPQAGIIYDSEKTILDPLSLRNDIILFDVPLLKIAKDHGADELMRNTVALGASCALLNWDTEVLYQVLKDMFERKGEKVVELNIALAKAGYEFTKEKYKGSFKFKLDTPASKSTQLVMTGNDAISLAALKAGCKFYVSYPMTPTSSVLHNLSAWGDRYGMIVEQPEDEISAINMAVGAGFAGVRAMTGTSGGGFSLMVEGLGLAGMTETPVVIVEGQRPGPATGLPTWTGQADLRFMIHASQDEFPRIVIAPGDVEESFYETVRAFNLAEKYQCPVIILGDKFVCESHGTCSEFNMDQIKIDRGEFLTKEQLAKVKDFKRYKITETGISPRSLPGMPGGIFMANSDEHDEEGWSTEESQPRKDQVDKRMRKLKTALKEVPMPVLYGEKDADITLVGWGSTKGPALDAVGFLKEDGIKANYLHFLYVYPFKEEVGDILKGAKKLLLIEGNSQAQLGGLIREYTGVEIENRLLKYDGRPFFPEEIYEHIRHKI